MADWPLKHDGICACRFVRSEEFGEAKQIEWCELHAKQRDAMNELARYFTSGNSILVERATILAKDFWRITGMTPNVEGQGRAEAGEACRSESPAP